MTSAGDCPGIRRLDCGSLCVVALGLLALAGLLCFLKADVTFIPVAH